MASKTFDMLASMRARYWDARAGHKAAASLDGMPAYNQDKLARALLPPEHLVSAKGLLAPHVRWPRQCHQKSAAGKSRAVHDAPLPTQQAREHASASDRDGELPSAPEAQIRAPVHHHTAAHVGRMPQRGTEGRGAPVISIEGRGELIASIVETGLQIATRMGDRAAAAAFFMPSKEATGTGRQTAASESRIHPLQGTPCQARLVQQPRQHGQHSNQHAQGAQQAQHKDADQGSTKPGPDALVGKTPAASMPDAGKNLTPAPEVGTREELQTSKSNEMKAGICRDKPGATAEQGGSISEQEPAQPLQAAVPKCQGVLSVAQRERLRRWTFLDGHTTVRMRGRRGELKKTGPHGRAPRKSRDCMPPANADGSTAFAVKTPGKPAAAYLPKISDHALEHSITGKGHNERNLQQAQHGKRKRPAPQHTARVLRSKRGAKTDSSNDLQQSESREHSVDADSKPTAGEACDEVDEISSSMGADVAGHTSAPLRRGSSALQRLASIALKM